MPELIICFTQAYNAETTIGRCIDSVKAQSYTDFVYYIADNASTDHTREIIAAYAATDNRIIPLYYDDNDYWRIYTLMPQLTEKYNRNDLFIELDADDEYASNAFESLSEFMHENELNIAACTAAVMDETTGENMSRKTMCGNLVVSGEYFDTRFPEYFRYTRDGWGKLYSLSLFQDIDYGRFASKIAGGSKTYLTFELLKNADKFGVLEKQLYIYHIRENSIVRTYVPQKIMHLPQLYACYADFLITKCGLVSSQNAAFLRGSYFNALWDRMKVMFSSDANSIESLYVLDVLMSDKTTAEVFSNYAAGVQKRDKLALLDIINNWLDKCNHGDNSLQCKLIEDLINYRKLAEKSDFYTLQQ
jgi:glycosyltransferase involved in cell wall biosynthesis